MAAFMGCHADSRHGSGTIGRIGKPKCLIPGIIMVCQIARNVPHGHIVDPVGPQNPLRRLPSGQPGTAPNRGIPAEHAVHA